MLLLKLMNWLGLVECIKLFRRVCCIPDPELKPISQVEDFSEKADLLRLSVFFRNNPVPILVCSPDGEVIKLNPAAEKMVRRQVGLRETELLPTNHQGLVQACLAGEIKEYTVAHVIGGDRKSQRVFAITYNAVPSFKLVYLYIVDITEYYFKTPESDEVSTIISDLNTGDLDLDARDDRIEKCHVAIEQLKIETRQELANLAEAVASL